MWGDAALSEDSLVKDDREIWSKRKAFALDKQVQTKCLKSSIRLL